MYPTDPASRGLLFGGSYSEQGAAKEARLEPSAVSSLERYFDAHRTGNGIWKWRHYFEIYHRHFARWADRSPHVLEVGIYSGGSLEMWRQYFGPSSRIYGVDIEPACRGYESDGVKIFIGDQADRGFWRRFKREVPVLDIAIDDGGHLPEQQIATLEELLPHLSPGGVYLCEDVHGIQNEFAQYISGLARHLHGMQLTREGPHLASATTAFQQAIHSIHLYPYVVVIEKSLSPVRQLEAPKHGTLWQPSDPGPR